MRYFLRKRLIFSAIRHESRSMSNRPGAIRHERRSMSNRPGAIRHKRRSMSNRPGTIRHESRSMSNRPGAIRHKRRSVSNRLDYLGIIQEYASYFWKGESCFFIFSFKAWIGEQKILGGSIYRARMEKEEQILWISFWNQTVDLWQVHLFIR